MDFGNLNTDFHNARTPEHGSFSQFLAACTNSAQKAGLP